MRAVSDLHSSIYDLFQGARPKVQIYCKEVFCRNVDGAHRVPRDEGLWGCWGSGVAHTPHAHTASVVHSTKMKMKNKTQCKTQKSYFL